MQIFLIKFFFGLMALLVFRISLLTVGQLRKPEGRMGIRDIIPREVPNILSWKYIHATGVHVPGHATLL